MNIQRIILVGLFALSVGACSLPGYKYESGGSEVWQGEKGQPGYDSHKSVEIHEITPYLTAEQARQTAEKNLSQAAVPVASMNRSAWDYHVGVGDVLGVIVWDHPELTNPTGSTQSADGSGRPVRTDGTMFYPHAGNIPVEGKTTEEIGKILTTSLARVLQSPQVDVTVLEYRSQFINIVGDVDQPCRIPVTDIPLTVMDALNRCKTIRPGAGNRDIELNHGGERRTVDLYSIYKGRDPLLNEPLQAGDTLYVKDDRANRIFVVGEFNKQATISIPVSGLTLTDAMNDLAVGGIKTDSSDAKNIYVFRGGISETDLKDGKVTQANFQPEVFHINVKSADALLLADQFRLQPRDIVYASTSTLVNYSRAVNLVFPTFSTLVQTALLIHTSQ